MCGAYFSILFARRVLLGNCWHLCISRFYSVFSLIYFPYDVIIGFVMFMPHYFFIR